MRGGGLEKNAFRPISRFISVVIQDRVIVSYYGMRIGNTNSTEVLPFTVPNGTVF